MKYPLALSLLLLLLPQASLAQTSRPERDIPDEVKQLNNQVKADLGISLLALHELWDRRGTDFGIYAFDLEKDKSWRYVRELVTAGYLDLQVEKRGSGDFKGHTVYTLKPTVDGAKLIEAMRDEP